MHRIPITMLCSITCSIALRFLFTYHKLLSAIIFSSVITVNILIQENLDLSNNTTTNVLGSISSTDIIFPWWYRSIWIKSISEIIGIYSQIDFILFDYQENKTHATISTCYTISMPNWTLRMLCSF